AALRALSAEARRSSLPPSSLELLAVSLYEAEERDEAVVLLRWARGQHPADFWVHYHLGGFLGARLPGKTTPVEEEEAIGCYRAALALRPDDAFVHVRLGVNLQCKGLHDEGIAEYRKAADLAPTSASVHQHLGYALRDNKGRLDEALVEFREVVRLRKDD